MATEWPRRELGMDWHECERRAALEGQKQWIRAPVELCNNGYQVADNSYAFAENYNEH